MNLIRRYLNLLEQNLSEAEPNKYLKSLKYYHGVRLETNAEKILHDGIIKPGITDFDDDDLAPVKNKVYLTNDVAYALTYSLESLSPGSDMPESKMKPKGYVYLFVVDGHDLSDIQPDEDSIGIFLEENTQELDTGKFRYIGKPDRKEIWDFVWKTMTEKQRHGCVRGIPEMQASGGKLVLQRMPDWMKIQFIEWGAHVANDGEISFIEAWRIEKEIASELKKDASNFFSLAEQIY